MQENRGTKGVDVTKLRVPVNQIEHMDDGTAELELLTPLETAIVLGVSPGTVARWRTIGKIRPAMRVGRGFYFWRSELEAVLSDQDRVALDKLHTFEVMRD